MIEHEERLAELVEEHGVVIGIITTPPAAAQDAADTLARAGVRSILNFAPTVLDLPVDVLVRDVDVAVELQILAFHEERRAAAAAAVEAAAAAAAAEQRRAANPATAS